MILYSSIIFADPTDIDGRIATILVGVFNLVSTVIAIFLITVIGRKTLLMVGELFMGASLITLGFLVGGT